MTGSRVDIGIPVFRRATFVAAAIESVLSQSYADWTLTVSEETGPTDAVRRAVEPYLADDRIAYVTPARLGVARHKSSLAARGDGRYIALLDDDDLWYADWLARRVQFMDAHLDCGLVWGGNVEIDSAGDEARQVPFATAGGVHSSRDFVARMMQGNMVATANVLLRRATYERAGNHFDARFRHVDDYELWLRMGLQGPVGYLPVRDAAYRLHDQQYHLRHERALDLFFLVDHLDGLLQGTHPELRLGEPARRRLKADRLLSAAMDAAEDGRPRAAARRVLRAAGLAPGALASQRGLAAVASAVGGQRISRRIGAMRPS